MNCKKEKVKISPAIVSSKYAVPKSLETDDFVVIDVLEALASCDESIKNLAVECLNQDPRVEKIAVIFKSSAGITQLLALAVDSILETGANCWAVIANASVNITWPSGYTVMALKTGAFFLFEKDTINN